MSSAKKKADAEKFQHQLLELLKDDANRVCADCRARGPRWASWNLGQLSQRHLVYLSLAKMFIYLKFYISDLVAYQCYIG